MTLPAPDLPNPGPDRPSADFDTVKMAEKAALSHDTPTPPEKRLLRPASGKVARLPLDIRSKLAAALVAGQSYSDAAATAGATGMSRKSIASWWRTAEAKRFAAAVVVTPAEAEALAGYSLAIALSAQAAKAIIDACIADPKPGHAFALQAAQATIKAAHTHKSEALAAAQQRLQQSRPAERDEAASD
ncbi:MAG: hypothetical protein C5B50_27390 [Verrucomicrobia bacterium]|nr:MAG: hypothetical protein C5B50_27390 [Verrucomicrobiota bacterium]